jgi:hypothetical protein
MSDSTTPVVIHSSDPNKWYRKLTDYPSNRENPFLEKVVAEMKVSVRRQTIRPKNRGGDTNLMLVDGLGTEHGEATFQHIHEVDEQEFTKMFRDGVAKMGGLSVRGTKVWYYICDELKPGATSFHFMPARCLEHTGYKTRGNILSGLAELLEASIIARSEDSSLYFINPAVMFNGNRLTFARTYVKKQLREQGRAQLELELNPHMSLTDLRKLLDKADEQ